MNYAPVLLLPLLAAPFWGFWATGCNGATKADNGGEDAGSSAPCSAVPASGPVLACGDAGTCAGATPVCCTNHAGTLFYCGAAPAGCKKDPVANYNISNLCDDAADCPSGQVCCDAFDNNLFQPEGARCTAPTACSVAHEQICTKDCECPSGVCLTGVAFPFCK